MRQRGYFITFEGGEGAGKSTQIDRLSEHLKILGRDVIVTREPGGTCGAEAVRHVLLSGNAEKLGPAMEAVLFAAARADHVDELIAPALREGKIILCDRFIDSTRVYQGGADVPAGYIALLEQAAIDNMMPDLTFILDLPAEDGLARANERRQKGTIADRFEKEDIAIHEMRREAFLTIAENEPGRCVIIDAARNIDDISEDIARITDRQLRLRGL